MDGSTVFILIIVAVLAIGIISANVKQQIPKCKNESGRESIPDSRPDSRPSQIAACSNEQAVFLFIPSAHCHHGDKKAQTRQQQEPKLALFPHSVWNQPIDCRQYHRHRHHPAAADAENMRPIPIVKMYPW